MTTTFRRLRPGRALAALALAGTAVLAPTVPAHASSGDLCYRVQVATKGWAGWECNGAWAGTMGKALPIMAVQFKTSVGQVCMGAHRSDYGWDGRDVCAKPGQVQQIGDPSTTPIEAIRFYGRGANGDWIDGNAYVRNTGWLPGKSVSDVWNVPTQSYIAMIGTTGEAKSIETLWFAWI
ncbi:hypothetical protein [Actinomadura parmotrematis]|uniref:Hydrophobic W protein n=1 Tax=Actinomadura parmotrematis TaxID=2864039 RepID=A0ABS7G281_9ACTN|nr:hypothetical protein [Actinomadura parmotrematis]MBW8486813.1 hypothetical protein [Actinomadura parmotrematis]